MKLNLIEMDEVHSPNDTVLKRTYDLLGCTSGIILLTGQAYLSSHAEMDMYWIGNIENYRVGLSQARGL